MHPVDTAAIVAMFSIVDTSVIVDMAAIIVIASVEEEETMGSGESVILFEVELESASKCSTFAFFLS